MFNKIIKERLILIIVVFVSVLISMYFYKKDKISFMPKKNQEKKKVVPFSGKEYLLSYYNSELRSRTIVRFEEDEEWEGEGELDSANRFEGKTSLMLNSQNNHESEVTVKLKERIKIDEFSFLKLLINLRTSPENIEDFEIILADSSSQSQMKYSLLDLSQSWTLLSVPLDKFSAVKTNKTKIEFFDKLIIKLVSRPKSLATINLDWVWLESSDSYLKDWETLSPKFISITNIDNSKKLLSMNLGASVATLNSVVSPNNYNFQADFYPLKTGRFGLYLGGENRTNYGYYFLLDGVGTNSWQIFKIEMKDNSIQTILLKKGVFDNFTIETGKQYTLKVEARDFTYVYYISFDNKNFIKLGEMSDESFLSGSLGFSCLDGSIVALDNFYFFQ